MLSVVRSRLTPTIRSAVSNPVAGLPLRRFTQAMRYSTVLEQPDESERQQVSLHYLTVPEHEAYAIYDPRSGTHDMVTGPAHRFLILGHEIYKTPTKTLTDKEYVEISYLDGTKEFKEGPMNFVLTPEMKEATIETKKTINAEEFARISYHNGDEKVVVGPATLRRDPDIRAVFTGVNTYVDKDTYVLVSYYDGTHDIMVGPTSFPEQSWCASYKRLEKMRLTADEYAIETRKDGSQELHLGPTVLMKTHETETLEKMKRILLTRDQHCIQVLKDGTREIISGPASLINDLDVESYELFDNHIINEDQYAIRYLKDGRQVVHEGPESLMLDLETETVKVHDRHRVAPGSYAVVTYNSGHEEVVVGPASLIQRPEINSIRLEKGLEINSQEAIVVYRENDEGEVERRIVMGPDLYIPQGNEWIHNFSWHGTINDDREGGNRKAPGALNFQKLRLRPSHMYVDVPKIRTRDDARLVMRTVIYYELIDIDQMLDGTNDVTSHLLNALSSDVTHFVANRYFEEFKRDIHFLQEMDSYPILQEEAKKIGYRVNNVVFRGYEAPLAIQEMHEKSITTRTKLQLETEEEDQKQTLEDMRLQKKKARADEEMALDRQTKEHIVAMEKLESISREETKNEVEKMASTHRQELLDDEHVREQKRAHEELKLTKEQADLELEIEKRRHEEEISYQRGLKDAEATFHTRMVEAGIDMSRVMEAEALAQQPVPEKRIEFVNTKPGDVDIKQRFEME